MGCFNLSSNHRYLLIESKETLTILLNVDN